MRSSTWGLGVLALLCVGCGSDGVTSYDLSIPEMARLPEDISTCKAPTLNQLSICGTCTSTMSGQQIWTRSDGTALMLALAISSGVPTYVYSVSHASDGGGVMERGTYDLAGVPVGTVLDLYPDNVLFPNAAAQRFALSTQEDGSRACRLSALVLQCMGTLPCGLFGHLDGVFVGE
jgi:hypothetical protein